jgi:hypothetical protein
VARRSRLVFWLSAAGLTLASLAFATWVYGEKPPVDRGYKDANLSGLRTEAEVVARLGPPGEYATGRPSYVYFHSGPFPTGRRVEWKDDFAMVVIYVIPSSPDGFVTYWNVAGTWGDQRSFFERLRDRVW